MLWFSQVNFKVIYKATEISEKMFYEVSEGF